MFAGIRDDFDPHYWTRGTVSVLLAATAGAVFGAGWLLTELLSRIAWFLAAWLAQWLFPPGFNAFLLPAPPLTIELTERVIQRDHSAGIKVVELALDSDMGDFDYNPVPDLDMSGIEAPPDPALRRDLDAMLSNSLGVLAILGSSNNLDSEVSGIFGSGAFEGDELGGLIGMIGTTNDGFGSGGLGSRGSGLGGGGSAVGIGGLGTKGIGGGGTGYGTGSGRIGGLGRRGESARMTKRATPKLGAAERQYIEENGSTACRVRVTVDGDGKVSLVNAAACPDALRPAATAAAKRSTYSAASGGESTVSILYRFE